MADALAIALRTAQHAGHRQFSATAVLAGYIAGGTRTMRVGSGDVMLPNHAPLVVAEAFGPLAELYPGHIDLGVGRAPGTDAPPPARFTGKA